jgi:hypothetical protein
MACIHTDAPDNDDEQVNSAQNGAAEARLIALACFRTSQGVFAMDFATAGKRGGGVGHCRACAKKCSRLTPESNGLFRRMPNSKPSRLGCIDKQVQPFATTARGDQARAGD